VKTISIVGWIKNEPAILQDNPIFRLACANINWRSANKCKDKGKESNLSAQPGKSLDRKPKNWKSYRTPQFN
jgi:hypothetical protein